MIAFIRCVVEVSVDLAVFEDGADIVLLKTDRSLLDESGHRDGFPFS